MPYYLFRFSFFFIIFLKIKKLSFLEVHDKKPINLARLYDWS